MVVVVAVEEEEEEEEEEEPVVFVEGCRYRGERSHRAGGSMSFLYDEPPEGPDLCRHENVSCGSSWGKQDLAACPKAVYSTRGDGVLGPRACTLCTL